jgi:hypothetical protein
MPDLWPEDLGKSDVTPPIVLLREQAQRLSKKTQGKLEGRVVTSQPDGVHFLHQFLVVVPSLDNYSYALLMVQHSPVQLYPAEILNVPGGPLIANDEQQYEAYLRAVFASDRTRSVIQSLRAQAEEPVEMA